MTTLGSIQTPHNTSGRVVIVVLEILGIGTLFYGLATVAEFFVSGQLTGLLGERRDATHDRLLLRPRDRLRLRPRRAPGRPRPPARRRVAGRDRHRAHQPARSAEAMGIRFIESYAADDEVLLEAGIRRARAVIACVDSDADNIFIALTARELAPEILIVARASAEDSEKKLLRAGADRVISPYKTSGRRDGAGRDPSPGRGRRAGGGLPARGDRGSRGLRGRRQARSRRSGARRRSSPCVAPTASCVAQPEPGTVVAAGRHAGRDRDPGRAGAAGAGVSADHGAERMNAPLDRLAAARLGGGHRRSAATVRSRPSDSRWSAPSGPARATTRPTRRCCWRRR